MQKPLAAATGSSTRAKLILLVAAILVPIALFALVLLWQFSIAERARFLADARDLAREVGATVDRDIVGVIAALQALATSPSLDSGDLASFAAQARALLDDRGLVITLRDRSGRQLVNTFRSPAEPSQPTHDSALLQADRRVLETGEPVVTDLFVGAVTHRTLVAVDVPVVRDGKVTGTLSMAIDPARLSDILASVSRPHWTVSLIDRNDRIVARSLAPEAFLGHLATADLRAKAVDDEGSWIGVTLDGTAVLAAYTRSAISGWRVAVGVPEGQLEGPLQRLTRILVLTGLCVTLLAIAVAVRVARTITDPIGLLTLAAGRLGRGEPVPPLRTRLREANEVGAALNAAAVAIRDREAALAESQARLRAVFAAVPVGVVIAEAPDGRIVERNAQAGIILGPPIVQGGDITGFGGGTALHPDGRAVQIHEYPLVRVIQGGEPRAELEALHQRGDGTRVWVRIVGAQIRAPNGTLIGGVVAVVDIDRTKRAQDELRVLNATLEQRVAEIAAERDRIWRISSAMMLVAHFDSEIVAVNPAWTANLGWTREELIGTRFERLIHPEDLERTLTEIGYLAEGRTTLQFENRYRHKDGSYRVISWTAVPDAGLIHAIGRDVTAETEAAAALRRTEEQLHQSQKMEVLGQLTGGVAHDFNNLLTVVAGNLDMAQRRLGENADPRIARNIANALEGARRAATLTHRLLAFARQSPLRPELVDLNRIVAGMSELIRRTLGENIAIETVLAGGLWPAEADPSQLESAILNLCVNARDAMPNGGKLTIETGNTYLDDNYPGVARGEAKAGQYAMVAVSDTGMGMSAEIRARVFEPFFTTKPVGKGTGLGLSQVFGFMQQSGGHAAIYSEVGQGTAVKLYLPRLRRATERADLMAVPDAAAAEISDGETVIVVEDEAIVRDFTMSALQDAGYRVFAAEDGPGGLALLDAHPETVLLFTDVVLTGSMNGRLVAEAARRKRPDLRVLFTTGYTRNAIVHHGRLDEDVELLVKPFTALALVQKVRLLLASPVR